jgi:hypothetical protein
LLAGTGQVHALVKDRHRSREFIEFLKLLDAAYPPHTAIKLILDDHSAHISKETRTWLAEQPVELGEEALDQIEPRTVGRRDSKRCATSASHPNRNSRTASWLLWTNSIAIPSPTLGPISSIKLPDMIRTSKSMN